MNNKGLTLIELVVSIAIASIVGIAIFEFMIVGAKSFQKTSEDVSVQHEAQLVLNQIQDMLVDTNIGAEYTEDAAQRVLTMYNYDPSDITKRVYEVVYNIADKKLYYNEYTPLASGEGSGRTVGKGSVIYTGQLLGENIENFKADLSDMEKRRVVRVDLEVKKQRTNYKTSSNITLRNEIVEGNDIPGYIDDTDTKDPLNVEGLDQFYFEPGREVNLKSLGGYKVKMEDGTDYSDQDIRFFMSERASYAQGTSVSTSGVLNISKAQKQDFYVMVASRTGKGASLEIKINMIVVDSVDIKLTSFTKKSTGETVSSKPDTVFEAGDSFELTAEVKGRNLDKAEASIYNVTWSVPTESSRYVTMETSSNTAKGGKCRFRMKDSLSIQDKSGQDPFVIKATSNRSTQIPYYTGTVATPVVGEYQAYAHEEPEDFRIAAKGDLIRGFHNVDFSVYMVNDIINAIPGFDTGKHIVAAKVSINEIVYYQEEDAVSSSHYDPRRDIVDSGSEAAPSGTQLAIWPGSVRNSNPNATFEYEVTFYIFDKKPGDVKPWQDLRVIPSGSKSCTSGSATYNIDEYKYRSNTVLVKCERLFLFYNEWHYAVNKDGTVDKSKIIGDFTTKIYPRVATEYLNGWGNLNDEQKTTVKVYDPANVEQNGITNNFRGSDAYRFYYKKDDTWVAYDDSRRIFDVANWGDYPIRVGYEGGGNVAIYYYPRKWKDDVPSVIRAVPVVYYTPPGTNQETTALLFDSYIEIYLWNIEIPTVKDYQVGFKDNVFDQEKKVRCYFPSPLDKAFSGLTVNSYKEWLYAYPLNVNGREGEIRNIKLSYKLSYNADGSGHKTWYLHLRYYDSSISQFRNLGVYSCEETGTMWKLISRDQVPDNLDFYMQ